MTAPLLHGFEVIPAGRRIPATARSKAFLHADNWNDWFRFVTMFRLSVFDDEGVRHDIGYVKIGQLDMRETQVSPELPSTFDVLDDRFFSLGQDDTYYLGLNKLGSIIRDRVLAALRDMAVDATLFERALGEEVTRESLMRDVSKTTVRGQFRRIAHGGARLSRYKFTYEVPTSEPGRTVDLAFSVRPDSSPPSNIHVLIGRNGVGKTCLLNDMTNALVRDRALQEPRGAFREGRDEVFAGVVSVTFSAFDPFQPLREKRDNTEGTGYAYIGLKRSDDSTGAPKTLGMLAEEFANSLHSCLRGPKEERWRRVLHILESDPMFQELDISGLADATVSEALMSHSVSLFRRLSSGHKIVLLTITRLVEVVEERTLVLLDEPEAHLHPPLLSAFVRALSDLLIDRNGVAIIATHSPVVLQEVPRDCTWILRRAGDDLRAERPEVETFGENVGVLTREVFGLEVTQSGFHRLLREAVKQEVDFESAVQHFNDNLGAEARAILRGLIAARDAEA